jgi:uncharacterized membrane protein YbhN (UPF0104 family)
VANLRKKGIVILKVLISAALIYFIFTKLNLEEVLVTLKKANPLYLFIALLLVVGSKIIAALRLNLYFHELEVRLTQKSNFKLYLLGMFYNLFLPGGIGGDAYKGYIIKKKFAVDTKKVIAILVLDRLSGLLLIALYTCILALVLQNSLLTDFKILFAIAIPLGIAFFWFLNKKFFHYVLPVLWKSVGYSALVQLFQLISILLILKAIGIETNMIAYLFIFLISSIVSVIPLTIGGIGSREVTFLYGATLLGLDTNTSVGVSVLFFLITAVISLIGIYYHFKKVDLKTQE